MSQDVGVESELWLAAVESSPSGLLAIDESGIILLVNREVERMFGYGREELLGQPIEKLLPARSQRVHTSFREQYLREATSRAMGSGRDLAGLRKDGTEVPVEIGLNPVRTARGLVVTASVVDITARRAAEQQLRQSQKMQAIGTLAGGIAHDFNNILMAIIGYTELSMRSASSMQREDLSEILRAAERGRQLVQQILTISRQRDVPRSRMSMSEPLVETLRLLRASLPTTIQIIERIDPRAPVVLSNDTYIHQIVMNLATNAAHAMPSGGQLTIELSQRSVKMMEKHEHAELRAGLYARLSVIDTGCGMTADVRERVFEPFFSTKRPHQGTGLGLSVVEGIVRSHGGVIAIDSEPGRGTRVDAYLPAAEEPEQDLRSSKRGSKHILLVEDEPPLARMMKRNLEYLGFVVTEYHSSIDALEYFKAQPDAVDLLVSDNTMPRMTGLALVKELHRLRPALPVLLVSGLAETADKDEVAACGVDRMLGKPHTVDELADAIELVLASRA